jgi:uncharacterized membrane protein YuzA (DUF378 family)
MNGLRILFQICLVIIIIGAINWGLVALDEKNDLIRYLFPHHKVLQSILYAFIGVCGIIACYIWLSFPNQVCDVVVPEKVYIDHTPTASVL